MSSSDLRRLAEVLSSVPPMFESLAGEMNASGLNPSELFEDLREQTGRHLDKAIRSAQERAAVPAEKAGAPPTPRNAEKRCARARKPMLPTASPDRKSGRVRWESNMSARTSGI